MKLTCSQCGEEIDKVIWAFTVLRYGTPFCYTCMKISNSERNVWLEDLQQEANAEKKKGKKK